ncbi:MAG: phosphoribosyltransferase [Candidatus Saccharimonadales bacterium]
MSEPDILRETWDSVYEKTVKLAETIEKHCQETGEQFDVMIVVPRGSYYPANIISRELGFGATNLLHACIDTYSDGGAGVAERHGQMHLGQMPTEEDIRGKNLLIIEEVCDKGNTLQFLYDRFKEQGANLIRTGVLHYKPGQSETGFVPDWSMGETDQWIVYPWEPHEDKGKLSKVRAKN